MDNLKPETKDVEVLLNVDLDNLSLEDMEDSVLADAIQQVKLEQIQGTISSAHSSHSSFSSSM